MEFMCGPQCAPAVRTCWKHDQNRLHDQSLVLWPLPGPPYCVQSADGPWFQRVENDQPAFAPTLAVFQLNHEPGCAKTCFPTTRARAVKIQIAKVGAWSGLGGKMPDPMPLMPVDMMLCGFLCISSQGFCCCNLWGPICWTFCSQFLARSRRMERRSQWVNSKCIGVKKKIAQRINILDAILAGKP